MLSIIQNQTNLFRKLLPNLRSFPQKRALQSGCASFCSSTPVSVTAQVKLRSKWERKHGFSIYEPQLSAESRWRLRKSERTHRLPLCDRPWGAEGGFYAHLSPPCRPSLTALRGSIKHCMTSTVGCKLTATWRCQKPCKTLRFNISIFVYLTKTYICLGARRAPIRGVCFSFKRPLWKIHIS